MKHRYDFGRPKMNYTVREAVEKVLTDTTHYSDDTESSKFLIEVHAEYLGRLTEELVRQGVVTEEFVATTLLGGEFLP